MLRTAMGLLVGGVCVGSSAYLASLPNDKWGWFLFVGLVISGWSLGRS